jgi:catechol 2,3-dioxygenase-like lactoylglutathione lyase family enzyme
MGIRIGSTVVNCADLESMTEFWTRALGLVPSSREPGIGDAYVVLTDPESNEFCVCAVPDVSA